MTDGLRLMMLGTLYRYHEERRRSHAHLADSHLVEAAERIGGIIAKAMQFDSIAKP